MSSKYIVREHHDGRIVPRCDLPGSPFPSRKAAKAVAAKLPADTDIVPVRRAA